MLTKVYFYIVSSRFPLLFNWSQSKASVVNQKSHLFFEVQKYFLALFNFLKMVIFATLFRRWSTKIDVLSNSIVSTLYNVVNINAEIYTVDLTLFNFVNFIFDIDNVVSKLIWHCPTLRRHITLTTMLRPNWKVSWVLTNVAKRTSVIL